MYDRKEGESLTDYANRTPRKEGESMNAWAARVLDVEELIVPAGNDSDLVYFGQEGIKEQIEPFITREESFPNTLILGVPGMGKTRLARWIAARRLERFDEMLCPVNADRLPLSGVVLLDECHRQAKPEYLFPYMEDPHLTVIGATTRPEMLEPAFKSRFVLKLHLKRYNDESMQEMAQSTLDMSDEAAKVYAGASAGNPRQLELILEVAKELGPEDVENVLKTCRISGDGLTEAHLDLLRALKKLGRPVGLSTLASHMYSDEQSVREGEQLLAELDLIELRPNGRMISRRGSDYLTIIEQTP